jgi:hypothetical protein
VETGSPHARYAIVERIGDEWQAELIAIDYDWEAAAQAAELRDLVADVLGSEATADSIDEGVRAVYSQCVYFMFMGEVLQRAGSPVFSSSAAVRRPENVPAKPRTSPARARASSRPICSFRALSWAGLTRRSPAAIWASGASPSV